MKLYQNICKKDPTFSHGDFAPWNIRKEGDKYIVFDWENCGNRTPGFDLMHYVIVVQVILASVDEHTAYEKGLLQIQRYIPDFALDERAFL